MTLTDGSSDIASVRLTPAPRLRLEHLNAVRGAAALYVVCHHARGLLFISLKSANQPNISASVRMMAKLASVFAFGHQAVILFFVLSGICIHLRQARQLLHEPLIDVAFRFDLRDYLWRRWIRIAPPFYFCLLLTALINAMTVRLNPAFAIHMSGDPNIDANLLVQHNSLPTFLGNLFFLQRLAYPTFGNNTALWSLAYEFHFYLLYPVYLAIRRRTTSWQSIGITLLISSAACIWYYIVPTFSLWLIPVLVYWFSWVMGALVADVCIGNAKLPAFAGNAWLGLAAAIVWLTTSRLLRPELSDALGAVVCAQVLWQLLRSDRSHSTFKVGQRLHGELEKLGRFSYSLYLIHLPVLALLCAGWFRGHHTMPTTLVPFVTGCSISVLAGWGTYRLVERRFMPSHS